MYEVKRVNPESVEALVREKIPPAIAGSRYLSLEQAIELMKHPQADTWIMRELPGGRYAGFAIAGLVDSPAERVYSIAFAAIEPGQPREALDSLMSALHEFALLSDCRTILFNTDRNPSATKRRLKAFGYEPIATTFMSEV
jgi:hypothetical protein